MSAVDDFINEVHVGITATRDGLTDSQRDVARSLLKREITVHHGDCVGGDAEIDAIAVQLNLKIEVHPPSNTKLRAWCDGGRRAIWKPEPYSKRNMHIVRDTSELIAFPKETAEQGEQQTGGTWQTVRMARRASRSVTIVWSCGMTYREIR